MIRVSKRMRANGYWYVRFWANGRVVDESAKTKRESQAESYRLRREFEINAGVEPLRHADMNDPIDLYLDGLPPKTSEHHRSVAIRTPRAKWQVLPACAHRDRVLTSRFI
jgi:hypothetical protein